MGKQPNDKHEIQYRQTKNKGEQQLTLLFPCSGYGRFARQTGGKENVKVQELSLLTKIGEKVKWSTVGGESHSGILKEWDNLTAIIELENGDEKAVSCGH